MTSRSDPRLVRRLSAYASAASLFSIAVGITALLGWVFHTEVLKTWGAGPSTVRVNTALCFVLLGLSLWLLRKGNNQPFAWPKKLIARLLAAIVILVGLLSELEYMLDRSLGIDHWWSSAPAGPMGRASLQLMSPITSLDFILLGLALLMLDWRTRRGHWPAQFLSLAAGAAAMFGVVNFIVDPRISPAHISLSVPTALTFAVFSFALACSRTDWGLGAVLAAESLGGTLLRHLSPAAILIPLLIGLVRWKVSEAGIFPEWGAAILTTVMSMVLLASLIAWAAVVIARSDMERRVEQRTAALQSEITRRKNTEEMLHESQARLAGIIASAMDAIITVDEEQRVVLFNAAAEEMFRCPATEILGHSIDRFIPQRFRATHAEHHRHFDQAGVASQAMGEPGVMAALRADGEEFQIEASLSQAEAGGEKLFTVILRDVTERKQAEKRLATQAEELARSEQALRTQTNLIKSILDSMGEGLVVADPQGKFLVWNRAAEKIIGYGPAELPIEGWAAHYGAYLPDATTPFPNDQLPLVRAIRGEPADAEMFIRNPALAEAIWIEVSARPLKDESGAVRGGVAAFRDVTQTKAAEREIRKLNEELEQRVVQRTAQLEAANRDLEAFAYSVSHDLRAPLRHIAGFSGILLEEFAPQLETQAQQYLQRIQDGTRRMGVLVDELLNLARIGRQPVSLQVVGLNAIVQEVVVMLGADVEDRQVEWRIADLPFVECDPTLIKQVFQNLLSNALKYSRPRPRAVIEVGQTERGSEPAIFVRDNGVGFSMKYANKLFGVFQRLHRSEDFEGTGVGLALVHRVIQKHGGRIWAESELDRGATFYFTLGGLEQTKFSGEAALIGAGS